jgi:type IV pilus assembly protein PilY1
LTDTELASPIVGEPAAFPAQTGAVADRVFVGDRDGRLWRVDLSDVDPTRWTMRVFFDAYADAQNLSDAQPIVTAPVLSVDDIGNITVAVSTGDQEVLTRTTGAKNYVYSLTEQISETSGDFMSHYNYRHIFLDGERVAGPMTLFDRKLFFATFAPDPDAGGACEQGTSDIWGVNYIQPHALGPESGGAPEFAHPAAPNDPTRRKQRLSDEIDPTHFPVDGVVFGVGIRQQPTCSAETQTVTDDQILGFGQTVSTTQATPGRFELVIQLPGESPQTGMVPTQVIDLREAPFSPVSIDSWALILE